MKWKFSRFPFFSYSLNLGNLKIITAIIPALFGFLFFLLWYLILGNNVPALWGTLGFIFFGVLVSFLFYRLFFTIIHRLQEKNIHRMFELEALNNMNTALDGFQNLSALLDNAVNQIIKVTAADGVELYLVDPQSRELTHMLHNGFFDEMSRVNNLVKLKQELESTHSQWYQQVIIKNPEMYRGSEFNFLAESGVRTLTIIPLSGSTENIGVICLLGLIPDGFRQYEPDFLLKIGNRIAVAIERARLYEQVRAVAVQEERERISKELHDGLAQVLSYVITKSQATRQLLRKITVADEYLSELENVAQEVYTDTRETILGLKTAIIGDRSMVSALREYAIRFNQMHGIKTTFATGDRIIPSLSPRIELQAIRIVQEALSNIRKHASATLTNIVITADDNKVKIVVEDDGKGFDFEKIDKLDWTRIGLQNMKERANSIGGHLFIESEPENGTKISLNIPLNTPQSAIEEVKEEIESVNS